MEELQVIKQRCPVCGSLEHGKIKEVSDYSWIFNCTRCQMFLSGGHPYSLQTDLSHIQTAVEIFQNKGLAYLECTK